MKIAIYTMSTGKYFSISRETMRIQALELKTETYVEMTECRKVGLRHKLEHYSGLSLIRVSPKSILLVKFVTLAVSD